MDWLKKKPKKEIVKQVHNALYQQLREKFNLPSKVAQDCYRNAIAIYNGGKTLWQFSKNQTLLSVANA
jgi:putative transposase